MAITYCYCGADHKLVAVMTSNSGTDVKGVTFKCVH